MNKFLSEEDFNKINDFKCNDPSVIFILKTLISAIIGLVIGKCSIEEFKGIINNLPVKDNKLSTTECCKMLRISKSTFEKRINAGIIKRGIKKAGERTYWDREYIDGLIKKG